jgi:osmoprotectant transport system permease protein
VAAGGALMILVPQDSTVSVGDVFGWLTDPAHWQSTPFDTGILAQLGAHVGFSAIALAIGLLIALPAGLAIGHTGRGTWVVSAANAIRALPTVGVLVLLVVIIAPHFFGRTNSGYLIPTEIVLVLLAIPPILSNTYAGVQNVEPAVRDAAFGMGMTGRQVLMRVELPNSLPLIFSGFRSATLQVIATATIASYVTLGGLGRFIYDGLAQQDFPQMISGGLLVAVLALLSDLVLAVVQRYTVSRGITGRTGRKEGGGKGTADSRVAALTEAEGAGA